MLGGILGLLAIYFLYILLIKGMLWKIIVAIAGWFGLFEFLNFYIPESKNICLTFAGHNFSWSEVIPSIIVFMAIAYTKEN